MNRLSSFHVAGGSLGDRRTWAAFGDPPASTNVDEILAQVEVAADGICLDAEGAVWLADAAHSRLIRVAEGRTHPGGTQDRGRRSLRLHARRRRRAHAFCLGGAHLPPGRGIREPSRRNLDDEGRSASRWIALEAAGCTAVAGHYRRTLSHDTVCKIQKMFRFPEV
jgi:hypothetical protein